MQPPPPDISAMEAACLGAILSEAPAQLPPNLARLIAHAPESFDDLGHGLIAAAIRDAIKSGQTWDSVSIARTLPDSRPIFLLMQAALPLDLAELEADGLLAQYTTRQLRTTLSEGLESFARFPDQALQVAAGVRDALERLTLPAQDSILARLDARRFQWGVVHADPPARYSIGPTPICTPGNITAISAGIKAGKSSFVGAMLAAAMTQPDSGADCLGVKSSNPRGLALLHFDTEQSLADHDGLIRRAVRRARVAEPPAWLLSYCLTGFGFDECRQAIRQALDRARREFGGVHSAIVDGVADVVADVNDPAASNGLVSEIHALAIAFDCPIVGVIHVNPGSETGKTRGHLGSQLERKAETNLRLEKLEETTVVYSDKNRRAPILKTHGPRFRWDSETMMHVSCECLANSKADAKAAKLGSVAQAAFHAANRPALEWASLVEAIGQVEKIGHSGARKRLDAMHEAKVLFKTPAGLWTLANSGPKTTPQTA